MVAEQMKKLWRNTRKCRANILDICRLQALSLGSGRLGRGDLSKQPMLKGIAYVLSTQSRNLLCSFSLFSWRSLLQLLPYRALRCPGGTRPQYLMASSAVLSGTYDAATFLEMNWKVGHRKYNAENKVWMGTADCGSLENTKGDSGKCRGQ